MMRLLVLTLLVVSAPAFAADTVEKQAQDFCTLIDSLLNKPEPTVAYTPGVDVNGQPVTPADLEAPEARRIHKDIIIPITIDLAARYGLHLPAGVELKPEVEQLTIRADGTAFLGTREVTQTLREGCAPPPKPTITGGQPQADTVLSDPKQSPQK